jgi:hypothetical protein
MTSDPDITKAWMEQRIHDFIATAPSNTMQLTGKDEPAWDDALVGVCAGADPIWQQYKEYIGAFHWTPWEVFNQHRAEENASADQLAVVSWVLPQRKKVRQANRRARKYPAEEWARIRVYGEAFNTDLRRHVVTQLAQAGVAAVAPMLAPNWTIVNSRRFSYASSWSERHAAHAAGLGTFGLCDGLITAQRQSHAAGVGGGEGRHRADPPAVRRPPGVLPFFRQRDLRQMHRPLPGARHHGGRPRQGEMPSASGAIEGIRQKGLSLRGVWLRPVPGGGSLRGRHSGQSRPGGAGAGRTAAPAAAPGLRRCHGH